MENQIVETGQDIYLPMTAVQIREQVNLIQSVMKEVMTENQHYGKIPGCGEKPTLLKPGAEKLSLTFRLRPIIDNDRDVNVERLPDGHINVRVYCHVMSLAGVELATGVGSCSTLESKFRYRGGEKIPTANPVPKEYWNLKKEGKTAEALESIGGRGFGVMKHEGAWVVCELGEKQENPDIADQYNTVLKMAKKRAYIDGILSATAASDIFTQDLEDIAPTQTVDHSQAEDAQPSAGPTAWEQEEAEEAKHSTKPSTQPPKAKSPTNGNIKTITEPQGKRLYAIAMGTMGNVDTYRKWLTNKYGFKGSRDIPADRYEEICEAASSYEQGDEA